MIATGKTIYQDKYPGERMQSHRFKANTFKCNGSTIQIYDNGSIVVLGCNSFEKLAQVNQLLGVQLRDAELKLNVVNVVYKADFETKISLPNFYTQNRKLKMFFNPELCRGLVIYIDNVTILLHHTGKAIITGCVDYNTVINCITIVSNCVKGLNK